MEGEEEFLEKYHRIFTEGSKEEVSELLLKLPKNRAAMSTEEETRYSAAAFALNIYSLRVNKNPRTITYEEFKKIYHLLRDASDEILKECEGNDDKFQYTLASLINPPPEDEKRDVF